MDTIRAFSLKTQDHLSDRTFEKLPFIFPDTSESPEYITTARQARRRLEQLAGFKTVTYDCCINSCMAYTGPHSSLDRCLHCKQLRLNSRGKPRQTYKVTPITPRLRAAHANKARAELMKYRAEVHTHTPGFMTDIFDSSLYRELLEKRVSVDGEELPYCHFSDSRDIALGLSTDGFAPFKKRKQTTWPIMLVNYNLPPEDRVQNNKFIPLAVVPGPRKPKDMDSFLWPIVRELMQLQLGVPAYDFLSDSMFMMRAYLIRVFGDIPAVSMVMRMKGHNGTCPCRMCNIVGINGPAGNTLYVPLDRRNLNTGDGPAGYDPSDLPLRTEVEFMAQAREVQYSGTDAEEKRLAQQYGIKGVPLLSVLSSLSFPHSFPFDFMHEIFENLLPNLVLFWTGGFKGLDDIDGCRLTDSVWGAIGQACSMSRRTVPSSFGAPVPNIASEKSQFTAENWSFWALYLAPALLNRRFQDARFHQHFVLLVKLINTCLQYETEDKDINELRVNMVKWVKVYERYVLSKIYSLVLI